MNKQEKFKIPKNAGNIINDEAVQTPMSQKKFSKLEEIKRGARKSKFKEPLAAKDKNILKSKVSAAALNGYAQIADLLADNQNIKLTSSIGSGGETASTIWKMLMYSLVLIGIIVYLIVIMRERKIKNGNK